MKKYNKIEIFDWMGEIVDRPLELLVFAVIYNLVEVYDFELATIFNKMHLPDNPRALNQLIDKGIVAVHNEHLGKVYSIDLEKIGEA